MTEVPVGRQTQTVRARRSSGPRAQHDPPDSAATAPPCDAVIFDMDSVVTDTSAIHAAAWKQLFDEVLADTALEGGEPGAAFDAHSDYPRYLDGRTREDGAVAFLAARGIPVPVGSPDDPPEAATIYGLAARKDELFVSMVAARGVRAYPGTVALLQRLRAWGVPTALVSGSRHAGSLLAAAGVEDLFDAVVDGTEVASRNLLGKSDPALFVEAARRLGVDPSRIAVIEDAVAGVQAARQGGFGWVVGVDRAGRRAELEAAGADVVVGDVRELDLGALRSGPWLLVYEGFDPAHEAHREALTTLGNGYLGTRGSSPERAADGVHYPGTYLAGVYNRLVSSVQGRSVEDEQLVNVPNWLFLDVRVGDGEWWSEGGLSLNWQRRELDLRRGLLTRSGLLTDAAGHRLHLTQRRLVSMASPHLAGLQTTLVADGWSGRIAIRTGVDAGVRNANVAEYAGLANSHLVVVEVQESDAQTLVVEVETSQSHVRIATASRTKLTGAELSGELGLDRDGDRFSHQIEFQVRDGEPFVVDKTVAVVTSRDVAIASPTLGAVAELDRGAGGFEALLAEHEAAWRRLWDGFAVELDADAQTQLVLNLHVFHLLQVVSPHTATFDVGIPARGLHGEGYRGHVFWDELFVVPLLALHRPEVARNLLDYRWRRLGMARDAARDARLVGALFPWQSGSDGREETPHELYNLRSQRWIPDNSHRQRHVGLAVAYNVWQYYQTTADVGWLADHGAEMIVEVARLFTAISTYDPNDDRFHVEGVMGPDEYHDGYPDAPGAGLRDNAYTNILTAWVCQRAVDVLNVLAGHDCTELFDRLHIGPEEPGTWTRLSSRMAVPFHPDGVISQFDGYQALQELDWDRYRARYGNIGRLDLILEAEGDSCNRYKLAKQADVLMLLYLLGPAELTRLLAQLGYPTSPDALARTVDYYLARTAHGSTLSRVVHASVLAHLDPSRAWNTFRAALVADLDDTQGGTTAEGVHLGAMAGTIDLVLRAFAGLRVEPGVLTFDPRPPEGIRRVQFTVDYRGQRIEVSLDRNRLRLALHPCGAAPVTVAVVGASPRLLAGGDVYEVLLSSVSDD